MRIACLLKYFLEGVLLCLLVAGLTYYGIHLFDLSGGTATFRPSWGIVLGLAFAFPNRVSWPNALVLAVADFTIRLFLTPPAPAPVDSFTHTAAGLATVSLVIAIARYRLGTVLDFRNWRHLIELLLIIALSTITVSLVGVLLKNISYGYDLFDGISSWLFSGLSSQVIFAPLIPALRSAWLSEEHFSWRNVMIVLAIGAGLPAILITGHYPALYILVIALVVVAKSVGFATAVFALMLADVFFMVALPYRQAGFGLTAFSYQERISMIELFMASLSIVVLPLLAATDAGARLRKELEVALQDQKQMSQLLVLRTTQFKAAAEEAESANRAKTSFLGNVSHELRTPLTTISGYCNLLMKRKDLSPNALKYLGYIKISAKELTDTVGNVLDYSRITSGEINSERSWIFIPELFEGILDVLRIQAQQKGLKLDVEFEGLLHEVPLSIQVANLKRVLYNIIGNAIKFTDTGFVHIVCSLSGGCLSIRVEDSGPGIADSERHRLFQRFSRIEIAGKKYAGTGLGLAISKALIDHMGGSILQENTAKGAVFQVRLPAGAQEVRIEGHAEEKLRWL